MKMKNIWTILTVLICLAVLAAALPVQADQPPPSPTPQTALADLERAAGGTLRIEWASGPERRPLFISGQIPADERDPEKAARAFFDRYAALYSIAAPQRELQLARLESDEMEMHHVRFNQTVNGVPVFGGQLIVHLRDGLITAVNGTYFPNLQVDTSPRLTQEEALAIVRADVGDDAAEFRADRSGLVVYVKNGQPYLTWKVNVFSWRNLGNWLYFVDAHDGRIVHKLNQLDTAKIIKVYTAHNQWLTEAELPGTFLCGYGSSTDPNCTVTSSLDARGAFTNTSKTYDYYYQTFGRDSYDDAGAELHSTVHYGFDYDNAFWTGSQMVFGDGDKFARAFDVVAHELTHGVIQETADLIYEHQPGALNESFADVMAVFAGCSASTGQADCDWLMGEDLDMGAIRNVANPGAYGAPDHWSEYLWLPLEVDNGGVHINSGIPNKAAYLLTAGGTYYGITVSGLGYTRTEQIYYRALAHYLTIYSGFTEGRGALYAACRDLIGTYSITPTHCDQVLNAWAAVGIGSPAVTLPGPYRVYLPLTLKSYPPITCSPSNILRNGSFEEGPAYWVQSDPEIISGGWSDAYHGTWLAWMGGYNNASDILYQTVSIPVGRIALQVTYYLYIASSDSTTYAYDKLYTSLQPPGSVTLPQIWIADNRDRGGWYKVTLTYNELPYAGQSMRLYFRATTDFSLPTSFFVDFASLEVRCSRYTALTGSDTERVTVQVEPVDGPPLRVPDVRRIP